MPEIFNHPSGERLEAITAPLHRLEEFFAEQAARASARWALTRIVASRTYRAIMIDAPVADTSPRGEEVVAETLLSLARARHRSDPLTFPEIVRIDVNELGIVTMLFRASGNDATAFKLAFSEIWEGQ